MTTEGGKSLAMNLKSSTDHRTRDMPKSCSRAMKATGVVEASCEEIFELVMSMDLTRSEWDCSFQDGSLVEEVDGHTAILYHRLQLDWFPTFVWHRDLCYVRYWRRNDDGSYVVLFCSREHENCGPQPGYVRAHIESGGFNISPLKPRNGRPRTQVQHLMQIDLKGWGVGYASSFQQHCLLQMLNSVAGLREYFAQTDERNVPPRIPVMVNMASCSVPSKTSHKNQLTSAHNRDQSLDNAAKLMDEYSDEDEDFQIPDEAYRVEQEMRRAGRHFECDAINRSRRTCPAFRATFVGMTMTNPVIVGEYLTGTILESVMPGGKHLMDLVAVDWFKDTKRMDHVARCPGCAAQVAAEKGHFSMVFNLQVPGSTNYSMVFYFVTRELVPGSLVQRFVNGDDEFRNSRMKLIPSVPKIDVDIGSSTVANGVLGLVVGAITSLVVDMAFLVQASVRCFFLELSSAIVPKLESDA
ncbi:enhanced disease resistance 2-like protein [Tanacetum coccineum]